MDQATPYIMLFPAMLLAVCVSIYPSLKTLLYSFEEYKLLKKQVTFVGFANYAAALADKDFWSSLANTLFFAIVSVAAASVLAMYIATRLVKNYPGRGFFRAMFLVPWVTPPLAASFIWKILLSENFSPINSFLLGTGIISQPINFLGSTQVFAGFLSVPLIMLAIINVWCIFPFLMVMFIAALQTVPHDLYEAAAIDGAGTTQRFWKITLPIIAPMTAVSILLEFIWQFNGFNVSYLVTKGGPLGHTKLLAVEVYTQAWTNFDYGYSATISCLMLLIIAIPAVFYIRHTLYGDAAVRHQ